MAAFEKANSVMNENPFGTIQSQITMLLATVECCYDAKAYNQILFLMDQSMNIEYRHVVYRRFAGMHKWKALALEQMGCLDDASADRREPDEQRNQYANRTKRKQSRAG